MSELMAIQAGPRLNERQAALVEALLDGVPEDEAKELAGYSRGTSITSVVASKGVQEALRLGVENVMQGRLKLKALKALDELLDDKTPAATRFQAAKYALDYGKDGDSGDKELSKMTPAELEAFIRKSQGIIEAAAKDVTPSNGA